MNKNVKKTVYEVLKNDELARTDDYYLIFKVLYKIQPFAYSTPFVEVMQGAKYNGVSFESITRARRKFFEENPELKNPEATEKREKEEENYITEYMRRF